MNVRIENYSEFVTILKRGFILYILKAGSLN